MNRVENTLSSAAATGVAIGIIISLSGCATPEKTVTDVQTTIANANPFRKPGQDKTLIAALPTGAYEKSALSKGEELDLAQRRSEGRGYVRSAALERYLASIRARLLSGVGVTGVPGKVMISADSALNAQSTPDGNVMIAMKWLDNVSSEDEIAAIMAHELSHVLLKHHSSDLISQTQKKAQSLYIFGLQGKKILDNAGSSLQNAGSNLQKGSLTANSLMDSKSTSSSSKQGQSEKLSLRYVQWSVAAMDRGFLPLWNRGQEREADLLGIDLLIKAGYNPTAMMTVLEKIDAFEKAGKRDDTQFQAGFADLLSSKPDAALGLLANKLVTDFNPAHPATAERIDDAARYIDRHYDDVPLRDPRISSWRTVASDPHLHEILRNYDISFSAERLLLKSDTRDAYAYARAGASGATAKDSFPNWIASRAALASGKQSEAIAFSNKAIASPEPVQGVYNDHVSLLENSGQVATALKEANKAARLFGDAPIWKVTQIRLNRKLGNVAVAKQMEVECGLSTPDFRKQCSDANDTPAPPNRQR